MSHAWKSRGEKRTLVMQYEPPEEVSNYLKDMQDAIRHALEVAYEMAIVNHNRVPSSIDVRNGIKPWFKSHYDYAVHHANPVSVAAVAMLHSYKKNHRGKLRIPVVKKLEMRIDEELFKIEGDRVRITLQPYRYAYVPINTRNKRYREYNGGRPAELLITDRAVCATLIISEKEKLLGNKFVGQDLNFSTVDSTTVAISDEQNRPVLKSVETRSIKNIAHIQNDFSRRRKQIQKHVHNRQKKYRKLKRTRGRQRNRVNDALQKLSTEVVRANPDTSFVFEKLKGIREGGGRKKGSKFRTMLNRWPYSAYQRMVEYKSPYKTVLVDPRGTSSECPVCGEKLKHPAWEESRCKTCGVTYDRNRLASLAIAGRGLRLCGYPFTVSADASWTPMKDEYLYVSHRPDMAAAGRTERSNAPNGRL